MTAMHENADERFALEVLEKLRQLVGDDGYYEYQASEHVTQLLEPLGFDLRDQCRVSIAIRELRGKRYIQRETARPRGHDGVPTRHWVKQKPRRIVIRILKVPASA